MVHQCGSGQSLSLAGWVRCRTTWTVFKNHIKDYYRLLLEVQGVAPGFSIELYFFSSIGGASLEVLWTYHNGRHRSYLE